MSLTLKFYKYDEKNMCDFFKFFINFISLCTRNSYTHDTFQKNAIPLTDRSANRLLGIQTIYGVHELLLPPSTF
jgi:hypothetical protein